MSTLMRLIPGPCFDVYVLRRSKQSFVVMLSRLEAQYGLCRATESIQEVIRALNLTMRDVEEEYRLWRHEYVVATLRSGFMYTKSRIRAACWRRHQGRSPAAFVGYESLYPAFRYAGTPATNTQSWGWQPDGGSVMQADELSTYNHNLGVGNYTSLAQPSHPQRQFTPAPSLASTSTYAVQQQYYAPPQNTSAGAWDYPPPAHPPPHTYQSQQQQQQHQMPNVSAVPASGSLPLPPDVIAAGEVATRFLEAVNKAVNICIELNAL